METPTYNSELRLIESIKVIDDKTTDWGKAVQCPQFTNLQFEVLAKDSADGNLKVYVAYTPEEPDWGDAVDEDNRYYTVACLELGAQASITAGGTGITISDGGKHYMVSTNGARWLNFELTGNTQGEVHVWVNQFSNI